MADLSITGEVVVTSEKAEGAFDRVGAKAGQMASKVQTEANKASSAISDNNSWAGSSTFDDFKSSGGLQEKKSNHGGFRLDSHFTAPDSNEEGLRFATLVNKLLII